MDAIDAIMTRRSVRTFEERLVPKDAIGKIIKAGTYVPSASE